MSHFCLVKPYVIPGRNFLASILSGGKAPPKSSNMEFYDFLHLIDSTVNFMVKKYAGDDPRLIDVEVSFFNDVMEYYTTCEDWMDDDYKQQVEEKCFAVVTRRGDLREELWDSAGYVECQIRGNKEAGVDCYASYKAKGFQLNSFSCYAHCEGDNNYGPGAIENYLTAYTSYKNDGFSRRHNASVSLG